MSFVTAAIFSQLRGLQASHGPAFGAGAAQTEAASAQLEGLGKMRKESVKAFRTFGENLDVMG